MLIFYSLDADLWRTKFAEAQTLILDAEAGSESKLDDSMYMSGISSKN